MKKIAFHWLILFGMLAGVLFGVLAVAAGWNDFVIDWVKPWGTVFINLLKLIAIPLILVSLVSGVSNLKDVTQLSRIGLKTLSIYLITTMLAISIGLIAVNISRPGKLMSAEKSLEFREKYTSHTVVNPNHLEQGPLQFVVDLVPENIVGAMSRNTNMLQVIFFAILFGVALVMLPESKTSSVKRLFDQLNEIVMQMIHLIMRTAPIGAFCLIASITVEVAGDDLGETISLFSALGMYALTVVVGLLFVVGLLYPLIISLLTKISFGSFIKGMSPAQLLAFSTSSSAATLPMTMQCCEENLGIKKEISSFALPLGATVNMDGTSLYQAVATVFLAQIYGIDLGFSDQLVIILTATLASIGSAAVPGAGMIMLVIVLQSVGVPTEGIALIFAVDRPLDMLRTVVNITGDAVVACIIQRTEESRVINSKIL